LKKSWRSQGRRAKRKGGVGEMNFCLPAFRRRRNRVGKRFRNSCISRKTKQKNFRSLIEKNFWGARLKKCRENFSVLLAEAKRRRAETLGGILPERSEGERSPRSGRQIISQNRNPDFV